jgi:endonuclease YncB( thermonuclease family)
MQFLRTSACVAVAILVPLNVHADRERSASLLVHAVVNGDTLDVAGVGHVRLAGIRAPRIGRWAGSSEPYAEDARRRLASIAVGRWVRLERIPGRAGASRSAYVWTEDGVLLNVLMLREGLAQVATSGRPARLEELAAAEADARSARRGLWSGGPGTPGGPAAVMKLSKPRAHKTRECISARRP